ncbi:hypothetical protein B0H11DRAFT_1676631, partial [Mycena galericulata]
ALAGEIQEGETAEVIKESSVRRRWVPLCWLLTWWIPCHTWGAVAGVGEKLATNFMIYDFLCMWDVSV